MTASPVPIERALADRRLLGAALGDLASWATWIAVIKGAYGRWLDASERALFDAVAGGRPQPLRRVKELVCVVSRRAGKGRVGAALAVHEACLVDHSAVLAPGETGVVAIISPTMAQSRVMLDYVTGFFESSPVLKAELAEASDGEVRLRNGVVIMTLASDYRSLRGRTLLLAILDEASFLRDELSRASDVETARAVLPGLMTTGGMLVILSSPYRRAGLVFTRHRDHFGKPGDDVLVVAGPSSAFNPLLDADEIERAAIADPESARAEWFGQFRSDLAQFLSDELIEGAIVRNRPLELPPRDGVRYRAFVDASAGRHDAFTIGIGHREVERIVIDVCRGRRPPFDPSAVAAEYARLAKEYRTGGVVGDNFSGEWVAQAFRAAGVEYRRADKSKSELYLEGLSSWTRGLVEIPDMPVLVRELRLLERRTARSGRDSVDHGPSGSDDHANVVFGALRILAKRGVAIGGPGVIVFTAGEGSRDPFANANDPWAMYHRALNAMAERGRAGHG
jgi:hypothetical protein